MKKQKILIVDDLAENLVVLRRVLRHIDAELIGATNGTEALKLSLNHNFSLALLDAHMPEMDGFDLALSLRSQEETRRLPIIFLSAAYSDFSHVFKGYESGAVDYLIKPYEPSVLCEKVNIFLELDCHRNQLEVMVKEQTEMLREANQKLNSQKMFLESILESLTFPLMVIDPLKQTIEMSNSAANKYFEKAAKDSSESVSCYSYMHQDAEFYNGKKQCDFINIAKRGKPYGVEFKRLESDGIEHYYEVNGSPIIDDNSNTTPRIIESIFDVTHRKLAEKYQRIAAKVIDNVTENIIVINTSGRIEFANPAFLSATGYAQDEVMGHKLDFLYSDKQDQTICHEVIQSLKKKRQWKGELWSNKKNGEAYPQWVSITGIADDNNNITHYVATGRDITKIKAAEEKVRFHAYHDSLTALPNRLLFKDRLEHALVRADRNNEKVAVLFIDLDHFKNFNDSMGHSVGDRLLKIVAATFVSSVRKEDTVARIGGDEFTVIMENITSKKDVAVVAKKLIATFELPINIDGEAAYLGASIGISIFPDNGKDVEALTKLADTAMYCVKEEGRNNFLFFTPDMERRIVDRMTLEKSIREGLAHDEFRVHYQPIIDIQKGTIMGMEALLRWQKPDNGIMSAAYFVPLAELRGLIVPLGGWVLGQACDDADNWQRNHATYPLTLSVNLSARQFREKGLVKTIEDALHAVNLPPEKLILEITETTAMENVVNAVAIMNEIKAMGVKLAMDDFGSGYSSFNYLKEFPVDYLKLDHALIKDVTKAGDAPKIATAMISLAQDMGLTVIAEGVENKAQLDFLKSCGCDLVQGFYFSEALTNDDFIRYVERTL